MPTAVVNNPLFHSHESSLLFDLPHAMPLFVFCLAFAGSFAGLYSLGPVWLTVAGIEECGSLTISTKAEEQGEPILGKSSPVQR